MCDGFEKEVIANLPHHAWTLTGKDLTDAVASLGGKALRPAAAAKMEISLNGKTAKRRCNAL